jgi:hypothetical protein
VPVVRRAGAAGEAEVMTPTQAFLLALYREALRAPAGSAVAREARQLWEAWRWLGGEPERKTMRRET